MEKAKKIRFWYGVALGVLTVVVGLLYIVQVADIYYGGPDPAGRNFSPEVVWQHLILPLSFTGVWAGAIVAGFVLSVVFPVKEVLRALPDGKKTLARLKRKMPQTGSGEDFETASRLVKKQEKVRIAVWACALAVCLAGVIATLVYVLDGAHYVTNMQGRDFNANMLDMLKNVMPWVGVALIACMGASTFEWFSVKKELVYVKQAIALGDRTSLPAPKKAFLEVSERTANITVLVVRILIAVLAVTFLVLGIFNGGADDVLTKAIAICTECIGLG